MSNLHLRYLLVDLGLQDERLAAVRAAETLEDLGRLDRFYRASMAGLDIWPAGIVAAFEAAEHDEYWKPPEKEREDDPAPKESRS